MKACERVKFDRSSYFKLSVLLLTLLGLSPTHSYAAPDCNPQSLAGRAVGGEIVNQLLGGFNRILGAAGGVNNGVSPTPSSAMSDCIIPRLNPPPPDDGPDDPSPVSRPAGGWGDPHLISHDGLGFDFQAAGDYAYVESDSIIVQARQYRLSDNAAVSRLQAFAVRFDDTTVVINDPIDPSLINSEPGLHDVITVNGEDMPISLGGWIDLDTQGSFIMRLRSHTYLKVQGKLGMLISHDGNTFDLLLDPSLQETVTGVLGNFDGDPSNDLQTFTGASFASNDTNTLYGSFLDGWRRQGEESLFNSPFEPSLDGNYLPGEIFSLADIDLSVREAAAQRCLQAGVSPGFAYYGCLYDMVFDEDDEWLSDAAAVSENGFPIVPASALASAGTAVIALDINASVSPMQPADAAGVVSVAGEVDLYAITIPAGTNRIIQPVSPCSSAQPFSLLLDNNDALPVEYALSCDESVPLPTGQMTLSVFSHSGDIGDYAFNILQPPALEIGVIALDELIQGTLDPQARLLATLPVTTGDRVFIASNQEENCGQNWELIDAAGTVIRNTSICLDLGLVVLEGEPPYSLQIQQRSASNFGFTVMSVDEDTVNAIGADDNRQFDLTITTPGQRASASFVLARGERIYVNREGGVLSGNLMVTDAASNEVVTSAPNEEDIQFEASNSGNYSLTLLPSDSFTGVVPITLESIADDINIDVSRGQTFTLTLSTLGQRAAASFNVSQGETFTVTATAVNTDSGSAIIPAVLQPGNAQFFAIFGSRTFTAEETGTYQVVIGSSDPSSFIGTVEFEID